MKICSLVLLSILILVFNLNTRFRKSLDDENFSSKSGNSSNMKWPETIKCPFKYFDKKGSKVDDCEGKKTVDISVVCPVYFVGDDKKNYYFDCKHDKYRYNPRRMSEPHVLSPN